MEDRRVLVVARAPVMRLALRNVLEEGGFPVVAEARSALAAAALAVARQPSLVVLHDDLPGVRGRLAARMLRDLDQTIQVVLLADRADEETIFEAMVYGIHALLPANADDRTLLATVRCVVSGRRPIDQLILGNPALAARVFNEVRTAGGAGATPARAQLTAREIAILDGVALGLSNREIADHLFVVEQTVKNHMTSVLRKMNAVDRTTAVLTAVRTGWIQTHRRVDLPLLPVLPAA